MNILFYLLFCLMTSMFSYLDGSAPAIIVTHGALHKVSMPLWHRTEWLKPGNLFYDKLNKTAKELYPGSRDFISVCSQYIPNYESYLPKDINGFDCYKDVVFPFYWDQPHLGVTLDERIRGGSHLAEFIIKLMLVGYEEFIVISHSYGGHVAKIASLLLDDIPNIPLSSNIYDKKLNSAKYNKFKEESLYKSEKEKILNIRSQYRDILDPVIKKKNGVIIDVLHTLATPNDSYICGDMNVIGTLYNHYSSGDLVDRIVGKLRLPKHELNSGKTVNLRIKIQCKGWFFFGNPKHNEMHDVTIGRHILRIPDWFADRKVNNFDKFSYKHNGKIKYFRNYKKFPRYFKGSRIKKGKRIKL